MDNASKEKELVGRYACRFVNDGQILGLGSGSTVAFFVKALGKKIREEGIEVHAIPTSYQIKFVAMKAGIPLTTLMEHQRIDVDIDGADEINPELNLMKGASASAFTMEKIVAQASDRFIIIADHRKLVKRLGVRFPVPVEVLPDAHGVVSAKLEEMGAVTRLRTRADSSGLAQPLITENCNLVLEARFREVADPEKTGMEIKSITGVVEHGVFSGMADMACVAHKNRVRVIERGRQTSGNPME
ncbi:MAG: ribose-5-phosphate isomerase RpiA [Aigarchaeota archaeon]|nr:ribose-5-phosphate isomerase RpiA [Aigarchaeota archaeon]